MRKGEIMTDEHKERISKKLKGNLALIESGRRVGLLNKGRTYVPMTEGHKAKIGIATARSHARGVYQRRGFTQIELRLYQLLECAGYRVERQVRFGRCVVDVWLPNEQIAFEADCMFWYHHQDAKREARRDSYLISKGVLAVVHLKDEDLDDAVAVL